MRAVGKSPIKNVFLKSNDVPPFSEAVEEISKADIIVIGPGSLYTSLITNLLVAGIRNAIQTARRLKYMSATLLPSQARQIITKSPTTLKLLQNILEMVYWIMLS